MAPAPLPCTSREKKEARLGGGEQDSPEAGREDLPANLSDHNREENLYELSKNAKAFLVGTESERRARRNAKKRISECR